MWHLIDCNPARQQQCMSIVCRRFRFGVKILALLTLMTPLEFGDDPCRTLSYFVRNQKNQRSKKRTTKEKQKTWCSCLCFKTSLLHDAHG